jgi:Fe2+ or Zn2+ uptake regulation protein
VYRNLNVLKKMGLVESRYFARHHQREMFETTAASEHHHFSCLGCGKIIEFETPHVERLRQQLRAELGVEFTRSYLYLEGYCAECVAKGSALTKDLDIPAPDL